MSFAVLSLCSIVIYFIKSLLFLVDFRLLLLFRFSFSFYYMYIVVALRIPCTSDFASALLLLPPLPLRSLTCYLTSSLSLPTRFTSAYSLGSIRPLSRLLLFIYLPGASVASGFNCNHPFSLGVLLHSFLSPPPPTYCSSAVTTSSCFLLFFVLLLAPIVSLVFMRSFVFISSHSLVRSPILPSAPPLPSLDSF